MAERIGKEKFLQVFPFFRNVPESLINQILGCSRYQKFPAGMLVKMEGDEINEFVLMLSGGKRIYRSDGASREITLYEIGPGDICVLNASSILSNSPLSANAATTEQTEVLLIPAQRFRKLVAENEEMRVFIYSRIDEALNSIMTLVSEVSFGRVHRRLTDYLIEKSEENKVERTHLKIANDLGTAREVVSRLLKDFERDGKVRLSRGMIELKEGIFLREL